MKLLLTIVVAAAAAFAGQRFASSAAGRAAAGPGDGAAQASEAEALRATLDELRAASRRLAAEIERRESRLVAAAAPESEIGEAEIAAALARWHADHPPAAGDASAAARAPAVPPAPGETDFASVPMDEIVRVLYGEGFSDLRRQELFQKLRENGRIDEYVATIEKLAAADPDNVEMQVALGHAYLQKLFGVANSPEAGPLAFKSDAAFTRALELDDQNWSARFSKAVSLSNWPAFLGRGPEAIEHFETLLEQQAALPRRNEFAMTYLFLGNMHQANGDREEAVSVWRAGLEQFPDMEELQQAIELATASDRPGR
jgi:tetratricopeptide (TPR) repeat protein